MLVCKSASCRSSSLPGVLLVRRRRHPCQQGLVLRIPRLTKSQSGLVPKKVVYRRNGKTVFGTVWVRSDSEDFVLSARRFLRGPSVKKLTGDEFKDDGTSMVDRISDYFAKVGGKVHNPELGTIVLNRRSIKDSLGHGGSRAKIVAFAAIPNVLRQGIVVDHQVDWKGRGYETYVVAAPVTIGVDRYFVGSVLISRKSGRRFYTHDLIVERESRDAPFKTGALGNEGLPGGTHPGSIKSILYRIAGVNTRGESSEEPGSRKRRDEEGA